MIQSAVYKAEELAIFFYTLQRYYKLRVNKLISAYGGLLGFHRERERHTCNQFETKMQ